jgi:nucleoside-diphosphate-sugar epimerase
MRTAIRYRLRSRSPGYTRRDWKVTSFPATPVTAKRSFTNDLVDCFGKVVELRRELDSHEAFLIAEPDVMSYAQLQDQIGELIHRQEWPTIRVPKLVAKAGAWVQETIAGEDEVLIKPWMVDLADAHYPVEIARARQVLGWEPKHLLRNTLSRMIGDLKADPREWYQKNKLNWPDDKWERPAKS